MKPATALRLCLAAVLLVAIAGSLHYLPLGAYLRWFLHTIQALGPLGPVVLTLVYAVVCLVFLPGSAVTLAAGYLYGVVVGTLIALAGATLGATVAFFISRFLLRQWVERRMAGHHGFAAIDRAIGREGFKIVLLCRLCSLIPFDLTSYASGISKVSFRHYVLATLLGRFPESLLFAYLGTTAKSLSDLAAGKVEFGLVHQIFTGVGLVAMVAVTVLIARIARRALQEAMDARDKVKV